MKRPYVVSMTIEAIVMAESAAEARGFAGRRAIKDEMGNASGEDLDAEPLVDERSGNAVLPASWEMDALVYGRARDESDLSVKQAIEAEQQRLTKARAP